MVPRAAASTDVARAARRGRRGGRTGNSACRSNADGTKWEGRRVCAEPSRSASRSAEVDRTAEGVSEDESSVHSLASARAGRASHQRTCCLLRRESRFQIDSSIIRNCTWEDGREHSTHSISKCRGLGWPDARPGGPSSVSYLLSCHAVRRVWRSRAEPPCRVPAAALQCVPPLAYACADTDKRTAPPRINQ